MLKNLASVGQVGTFPDFSYRQAVLDLISCVVSLSVRPAVFTISDQYLHDI